MQWIAAALLVISVRQHAEGAVENTNGAEFNILCKLVSMLDSEKIEDVKAAEIETDAQSAWTEIQHIYIMTENDTYYSEGSKGPDKDSDSDGKKRNERIQKWKEARETWAKADDPDQKGKKKYTRVSRLKLPQAVAAKLDSLYTQALKIDEKTTQKAQAISAEETKIRAAVRAALYGKTRQGTGTSFALPDDIDYGTDYAAACAGTAGPGNPLANDLMCLCSAGAQTASGTLKQCTTLTTSTFTDTGNNKGAFDTIYGKLKGLCHKQEKAQELTPEGLTAAIAAFTSRLGHTAHSAATDKGAYTFGRGSDNAAQCTGASVDSTSCVNYNAVITASSGTTITAAIKWLGQISIAITSLETRRKLVREKEAQEARMISLHDSMQQLYEEAKNPQQLTANPDRKQQQTPPQKLKECEKYHNKSKECTDNGCKWKGTDEKTGTCEVDESKVTTQTNTGGTGGDGAPGAAATTGCAKHKNQPDCEKEKIGEKQNCAWRKGKDNEPDQDKEMCRNGSFLVNNKLVLSIDAAFVSLVAF
uniref:Variant surface glycoprotein n=1 Tax=Trypanosoma brucei TaxID=5691 RepID=A0A1V0G0C1_9TRYP|nr:variant surface glycoprotein [Trypanosoma brucei]